MDHQTDRGFLHRMMFGRGAPAPAPEHKEMTRGQQTAWILAALAIVAFLGWNYMETQRDPCASVFELNKIKCQVGAATERLSRLP